MTVYTCKDATNHPVRSLVNADGPKQWDMTGLFSLDAPGKTGTVTIWVADGLFKGAHLTSQKVYSFWLIQSLSGRKCQGLAPTQTPTLTILLAAGRPVGKHC